MISELDNSVLIVAHPDDEVLWFSSLLSGLDKIIIIFRDYDQQPGLGERRAKAIAELPYEVVCLSFPEVGCYELANWHRPEKSPYGLNLKPVGSDFSIARAYERNFALIRAQLKTLLASNSNVFTHNPWGEYGHEDHVQLYRIVESLRVELGFRMYVSCYISKRCKSLAQTYVESGAVAPIQYRIDQQTAKEVANIYKCNRCWTWVDDWEWAEEENFLAHPTLLSSDDDGRLSLANSPLLRLIPSPDEMPS